MSSLSAAGARVADDAPMLVAPWFRGDLAFGTSAVEGASLILEEPSFAAAAREVFDAPIVVPHQVYVNLNPAMPQVDPGHVDVPTFRGVDRSTTPIWLLATMLKSGLFEPWYVRTATAVAWFYEGPGGALRYWPEGPEASPRVVEARGNTAIVGDNDRMFHCVLGIGERPTLIRGLSLESQLFVDADGARIVEAGSEIARFPLSTVRVSISWKAFVFDTEDDRRRFEAGAADPSALTLAEVARIFREDLHSRGDDEPLPADITNDRAFTKRLNAAYGYGPSRFD